jgi:hypothetical protein
MDAFVIGLLTSACVLAGALVGLNLRRILPEHHLTKETQEVVRLGSSTVSIVASLVLGLLIATAKTSSDNLDREMQAFSADLVMMDEVLRSYGHEAEDLRALLRQATLRTLHDVRPAPAELLPGLDDAAAGSLLSQLQQRVRSLPAKGLAQEGSATRPSRTRNHSFVNVICWPVSRSREFTPSSLRWWWPGSSRSSSASDLGRRRTSPLSAASPLPHWRSVRRST